MPRLAPLLLALVLCGCETGPHARIVNARFACEDGRNLAVAFNLDQGSATVRLTRKETIVLARAGAASARDYTGSGYRLHGVGDVIAFTSPTGSTTRCQETR